MTGPRAITCPSCGGAIGVTAAGYTVSVACKYCGTVLDVANDDVRVIQEYHNAIARLDIPLGTRATLFGVTWEAVGWLERSGAGAVWQEYLLFNPYAGYRWLVSAGGQWQFGTMLTDRPVMANDTVAQWRGRGFELDDEAIQIATRRVLGEFYWRVRAGDVVNAASFVAGNDNLSCEWSDEETQWTHLVPVSGGMVRSAFAPPPPEGGPARDGARDDGAGVQPQPGRPWAERGDLWRMLAIGLFASLGALLLMAGLAGTGGAVTGQINAPVDAGSTHGQVGPVAITRASQMVTVKLQAQDFTNKWIDLELALVDRATHQGIAGGTTIEHYSGYDSDGNWSEGSHSGEVHFANVPRGTYDLVIEAEAHRWSASGATPTPAPTDPANPWAVTPGATSGADPSLPVETIAVGLLLETGGMDWSLWWLIAALATLPPVIMLIWRAWRENNA